MNITDKPLAAPGPVCYRALGLGSYRYRGAYGYIMIGAKDRADAMREAARSLTHDKPDPARLEVWNGRAYVSAQP